MDTEYTANCNPTQRQLDDIVTTVISRSMAASISSTFRTSYMIRELYTKALSELGRHRRKHHQNNKKSGFRLFYYAFFR